MFSPSVCLASLIVPFYSLHVHVPIPESAPQVTGKGGGRKYESMPAPRLLKWFALPFSLLVQISSALVSNVNLASLLDLMSIYVCVAHVNIFKSAVHNHAAEPPRPSTRTVELTVDCMRVRAPGARACVYYKEGQEHALFPPSSLPPSLFSPKTLPPSPSSSPPPSTSCCSTHAARRAAARYPR